MTIPVGEVRRLSPGEFLRNIGLLFHRPRDRRLLSGYQRVAAVTGVAAMRKSVAVRHSSVSVGSALPVEVPLLWRRRSTPFGIQCQAAMVSLVFIWR